MSALTLLILLALFSAQFKIHVKISSVRRIGISELHYHGIKINKIVRHTCSSVALNIFLICFFGLMSSKHLVTFALCYLGLYILQWEQKFLLNSCVARRNSMKETFNTIYVFCIRSLRKVSFSQFLLHILTPTPFQPPLTNTLGVWLW